MDLAREALLKDTTAAKNWGKVLTLSLLKRQNDQRLDQIERQIAAVEVSSATSSKGAIASLLGLTS